ncbi:MAG: hypothetical protein Q7V17_12245 [Afipia sp.]|nr:hypothetical protein [Afipia sp.]
MTLSANNWSSDSKEGGYDEPIQTSEEFEYQQGKPIKAIIGIALLVVLALVLSRMNPAPHAISNNPAVTTGQTTGSATR